MTLVRCGAGSMRCCLRILHNCRYSDPVAETGEFAGDAAVTPGGVVGGHVDDEVTQLHRSAGPPGRPAGLGPTAGDSASVPTQQGIWRDEPGNSPPSGQGRRDRTQQRPVLIDERWPVVLPARDCELVAKHDDLEDLRASRANSQARQRHQQPVQNPTHRTPGCRRIMAGQRPRPHLGHPHAQTRPLDRPFDAARTGVPQRQEVIPRRLPGNPARVKTKASLRLG